MNQSSLRPARIASLLLPPLLVMAAIFFLSGQQSDGDHGTFVLLLRKLAHVTEYAVLTLLWARALGGLGVSRDPRMIAAAAVGIALAYSITDEFHQTFVEGRNGTPVDVLIDSIGMAIGAFVATRAPLAPGSASGLAGPAAGNSSRR